MKISTTPDNFNKRGIYKFICFEGGVVMFCDAVPHTNSHKQVVDEHPHLKPVSAGTIAVNTKKWKISDTGSMSAKLPGLKTDAETLDKALKLFGFSHMEPTKQ